MNVHVQQNDQSQLESDIDSILFALESLIQPSDECRAKVVPFLCLNTFGLCGEDGIEYGPSSAYCYDVRDNVCESEWREANDLLESIGDPPLPDCSSFTDEGLVCNLRSVSFNLLWYHTMCIECYVIYSNIYDHVYNN